jgi:Lipid A 3-O-deacylase (PagL)
MVAIALAAGVLAPAASRPAEVASPLPVWHVGPYLGVGLNSPGGDVWGETPDRNHLLVGVRGSAPVLGSNALTLAYAPEIVPILIVTNNPTYQTTVVRRGGVSRLAEVEDGRAPVYGFGLSPFGLEALVRTGPRIRLFGAVATGMVWFTREVPVANSRAFNYTFELGGGLLWEYEARRRLRFGYMFHHLSNAWTAEQNPGLDGDVFYIGWETAVGGSR